MWGQKKHETVLFLSGLTKLVFILHLLVLDISERTQIFFPHVASQNQVYECMWCLYLDSRSSESKIEASELPQLTDYFENQIIMIERLVVS